MSTLLHFFYQFFCFSVTSVYITDNNNNDVGRKITERSGDERETQFLFQRISVVVQWCFVARQFLC